MVDDEDPTAVYVLESLFRDRPSTVWFDYLPVLGLSRTAGLERRVAAPGLRLSFKADRTIKVVIQTLRAAGFRAGNGRFQVFWGPHLDDEEMRALPRGVVINHVPGSFALGRKDNLSKHLRLAARRAGDAFDFVPKTYLLPADRQRLLEEFGAQKTFWIVKPAASAKGRGIKVISGRSELPGDEDKQYIVQEYLDRPLLIDGRKWDMRVYLVVTCWDPLRAYLHREAGMARFASHPYDMARIKDRFAHLTNFSVNKAAAGEVEDIKWSLPALLDHIDGSTAFESAAVWAQVIDIAAKTLLSVEGTINNRVQRAGAGAGVRSFELLGLDLLLQETGKVMLLRCGSGGQGSEGHTAGVRIRPRGRQAHETQGTCVGEPPHQGPRSVAEEAPQAGCLHAAPVRQSVSPSPARKGPGAGRGRPEGHRPAHEG